MFEILLENFDEKSVLGILSRVLLCWDPPEGLMRTCMRNKAYNLALGSRDEGMQKEIGNYFIGDVIESARRIQPPIPPQPEVRH